MAEQVLPMQHKLRALFDALPDGELWNYRDVLQHSGRGKSVTNDALKNAALQSYRLLLGRSHLYGNRRTIQQLKESMNHADQS